ncbi:hypothetical protein LZ198_14655 [Myxococcus sp. K15C18031901]|uniref:hypothetical protein n=1 Tax=Myxococcus dinghuensis TaxID=2906761 RepID=UPI0020A777AD|nr:hypothetical protein [Myxococcus dinghuensis]MCP3100114.1 hypothetical protein [Myxococcus dinghuensis]
MSRSMEDYLRLAVPSVPSALISAESLAPILALARRLPPCSSSGFECRLGDDAPVADFLVNLLPADGSRAAFAGHHPDHQPPDAFLHSPVWQRVRDYCRAWAQPDSPLHQRIRDMWLEFDQEQFHSPVPIPGVFFGPEQPVADIAATVCDSLALLRGPDRAALPPALQRCLERLPGAPRVEQVGMMFSRQTDALRLCIRGVPLRGLGEALRHVGWEGQAGPLDAVLERTLPFVDDVTLDIDVGDGLHPKLGLECILDKDPSPARWKRWLDQLVEDGLCTPAKRDALLTWPGMLTALNTRGWPENLLRASEQLPGVHSGFARRINHLKLIHQPGQPLQVKAYLAFRHFWFRHASSQVTA